MNTFDIHALSSAERFVIWSLRLGLSPQISSEKARSALISGFRAACVSDALPHFTEMTETIATLWYEEQHVPDVHCTCCPCIGKDEWRLVQAVAALQFRDVALAVSYLAEVLPPAGIRSVLHRAMHVAAILGSVGWTLRCVVHEAANCAAFHAPGSEPSIH
ncbi:hypothetical protein HNQ60_003065 [Povalibacter uvarum]|uniref:Uncharacterized protein n=1 Tax=Povalibacter uvarum TaxID=732238 RepID=A0A841HNJ1_9GAMM|nr:hypothetical protein [Povalibacter uvarum]MBB6094184.1 hypothetical protein [Povalibacter uvarum]